MKNEKQKGVTLLEILLVLAIASTVLVMIIGYVTQRSAEMRRDRVSMQIQQILSAGMAYYVNNSKWPVVSTDCSLPSTIIPLQNSNYLPSGVVFRNPWGNGFAISCNLTTGNFYVSTNVTNTADAATVAGRLPFGYVAATTSGTPPASSPGGSVVVASVTIPGQNLSNARSVNFAGVYKSGACVPAPVCPGNMQAQIFVSPVEVSGVYDPNSSNVYPINSFSAYARGDASGKPTTSSAVLSCQLPTGSPSSCTTWSNQYGNPDATLPDPASTEYWRVCLSIITEKGMIRFLPGYDDHDSWVAKGKNMGSIMAFTRCAPNNGNEIPRGSPFGYFGPMQGW